MVEFVDSYMPFIHGILAGCFILMSAICYRVRGGMWGDEIQEYIPWFSNVASRTLYGVSVTLIAAFVTLSPYPFLAIPAWYLAVVFGWFDSADIGRDDDRSWLTEFGFMTLRGFMFSVPVGVAYWLCGFGDIKTMAAYFLFGLGFPIVYELGHRTPSTIPNFNQGMEVSEFYVGLYWGLVTAIYFKWVV